MDVMAWLTTGMFSRRLWICLDGTRTGHGVFVLSWWLLSDLLSLHAFITDCDSMQPLAVLFLWGIYHLYAMTG